MSKLLASHGAALYKDTVRHRPRRNRKARVLDLDATSIEQRLADYRGRLLDAKAELDSAIADQEAEAQETQSLRSLIARIKRDGPRLTIIGIDCGLSWTARWQVRAIEKRLSGAGSLHMQFNKLAFRSRDIERLKTYVTELSDKIINNEKRQERLKARDLRAIAERVREANRLQKYSINAALAAQVRKTVRSSSVALRSQLRRDHPCPYCFGPLGKNPQADHIHPVAKGGLPTLANYVFVCAACNGAKRDLTLNQFLDRMGFDREHVLKALRALGKDA